MSDRVPARPIRAVAASIAGAAAVLALPIDGDFEITLMMVAAVAASLLAFDASMRREVHAFWPWLCLSLAPVAKTVPTVWFELRSDSGLLFERYDHTGSLLLGLCMFGAAGLLAEPAPRLGRSTAWYGRLVIIGTAVIGALAGASVGFLNDTGFGSMRAARLLETPTWFVLAGLLAAVVIAASHERSVSFGLAGVLVSGCTAAALLAISVAGRDFDQGWWAMLFAAIGASATRLDPMGVTERDRPSFVVSVVAASAGLVAAVSAIVARNDRMAWSPGWALLGVLAIIMFAMVLAARPGGTSAVRLPPESLEHARSLRRETVSAPVAPARVRDTAAEGSGAFSAIIGRASSSPAGAKIQAATGMTTLPRLHERGEPPPHGPQARPPTPAAGVDQVSPAALRPAATPVDPMPSDAVLAVAGPTDAVSPDEPAARSSPHPSPDEPAARSSPHPARDAPDVPLSDAGLVASARAAAAVRTAPPTQRHDLAPLAQAHHFDPSTGLLSASGLRHGLARAFDVPRHAGHVTLLMFGVRNLDAIEHAHGRLVSASVTTQIADRLRVLLPNETGARFARAAFAVVIIGDRSDIAATTRWLSQVIVQLRAPIDIDSRPVKIDVVAGMAQCYEREDASPFVRRANAAFARAMQLAESTLVVMP